MAEANDKGAAVRLADGTYIFSPTYTPEAGDKAAAAPLKSGETYIVPMAGNADLKAEDKPLTVPSESGTAWATSPATESGGGGGGSGLPQQITAGVSDHSASRGQKESLGTFTFTWDGNGSIYISGSSGGATSCTIKDGVYIGSAGTQNTPELTGPINITSWGIASGQNTIEIKIGNIYGSVIGCSALYLVQA